MWKTAGVGGPITSERRGLFHVDMRVTLIMNSTPACAANAIPCSLPATPFRNLLFAAAISPPKNFHSFGTVLSCGSCDVDHFFCLAFNIFALLPLFVCMCMVHYHLLIQNSTTFPCGNRCRWNGNKLRIKHTRTQEQKPAYKHLTIACLHCTLLEAGFRVPETRALFVVHFAALQTR
jgi:hypothetical protein